MSQACFKVYEWVWVIDCNKISKMQVFAVVESMDDSKESVAIHYQLVTTPVGTGWGNYEGQRFEASEVFATKEDLIKSL